MAALLRVIGLGDPGRMYFDEVYYAEDAIAVAEQGVEERRTSHPPLGPALISIGVTLGGEEPWAWRIVPALAGVGVVAFTGLAALRLGLGAAGAIGAMLLVAFDGLSITMSRIAMLDVLVALFVVAGFWAMLRAVAEPPDSDRWARRLSVAGGLFGLATAVKWSGAFAVLAGFVLVAGAALRWLRDTPRRAGEVASVLGRVVGAMLVVPAAAYVLSYAGWFANYEDSAAAEERCPQGDCVVGLVDRSVVWWEEQVELVAYHRRLPATHPYRSAPESWPWLQRPVLYYFEDCPVDEPADDCVVARGEKAKILGLGNPAVWWAALPAVLGVVGLAAFTRRFWAVALLAFLAAQYVPWFFAGKDGYLFYMTPLVPFLALSVAAYARWRWGTWLLALVVAAAVAAFTYFAPVWFGLPLPAESADARMWLGSWR